MGNCQQKLSEILKKMISFDFAKGGEVGFGGNDWAKEEPSINQGG